MNIKVKQIQGQDYSQLERVEYIHHIQVQCEIEPSQVQRVTNSMLGHKDKNTILVDSRIYNRDRGGSGEFISVDQLELHFKAIISELRCVESSAGDRVSHKAPTMLHQESFVTDGLRSKYEPSHQYRPQERAWKY